MKFSLFLVAYKVANCLTLDSTSILSQADFEEGEELGIAFAQIES